jgi:lysophospholipase
MLSGLVLSSPAFGMNMEIPIWKSAIGKMMSSLWPSFSLKSTINPHDLSKDKQVVECFCNDPLIFPQVSSRLYTEVLRSYKNIGDLAHKISIPIYFQISGNDNVVSPKKSLEVFQKLSSSNRKFQFYDNHLHEIYNEQNKEQPINDLVRWLNDRVLV